MDQATLSLVNRRLYFATLQIRQLESLLVQRQQDVESTGKIACAREAACWFLESALASLLSAISGEAGSDQRLFARLAALRSDPGTYSELNFWISLMENRDSWLRALLRALEQLDQPKGSSGKASAAPAGAGQLIIAAAADFPSPADLRCWVAECQGMMDSLRDGQEEY